MNDGTTDKIKGKANEVAGKVKRGVGEAFDDKELKESGDRQEAKGDMQKVVGKVKGAIDKATE